MLTVNDTPTMTKANNVIEFPGLTTVDLPPDTVLGGALDKLEYVVVIGYSKCDEAGPGGLYIASSTSDIFQANFILDEAKQFLLYLNKNADR